MTDDLRYPVGKFVFPSTWDGNPAPWRQDIAELPGRMQDATGGLNDSQLDTPYRDGGWTVRQVVHHVADSHLNAYCRIRLALTEDAPTIKPYLEARWAELIDARTLPIDSSLALLSSLHLRLDALLGSLSTEQWDRTFVHPEHNRALTIWQTAALYAWHSRHHVAHINALRVREGW